MIKQRIKQRIPHHTVISALAIPIHMDMKYMKPLMLLGKRKMLAPQNIQRMPPAE